MNSNYPIESNRIENIHRSFKREAFKSKIKHASEREKNKSSWRTIEFPERINLIQDPSDTLKFFNVAQKLYDKGFNVNYDLSKVKNFSPESIAVLAASIQSDHFTQDRESKGNSPKNFMVNKVFAESGFYDHVSVNGRKPTTSGRLVHKVTKNRVEPEIARDTCSYILKKLNLRYKDDTEPFYTILIEAMQNTNNHASNNKDVDYDWWLYRYEDKNKKRIHFTFLDIGVGVFKSKPVDLFRKIKKGIKIPGIKPKNIDLIDDLLAGNIKSRTGRKDRGKGIPQIYEMSKDDMIDNFYILSNDILINTKTKEYTELKNQFSGTLYYWTINTKK